MANKTVKHYGIKRRSGRYPWGSGGHSQQRTTSFLGYVDKLKKEGLTETEIATAVGMSTTELRQQKSIEKTRQRAENSAQALAFKDKGMSNTAIGERMGVNESTVRSWLNPTIKERASITKNTAAMLKGTIAEKGVIDIGGGVEANIGISATRLSTAVKMLKDEGYQVMHIREQQLGTGKYTSIKVLAPPGVTYSEVYKDRANISSVTDFTKDKGRSYEPIPPIEYVSSERVKIRYAGEGGENKDGVIELRPGVPGLDLGAAKYAQVRIGVDGKHYLKGMAIYSNDVPEGSDIVYNVTKKPGTPKDLVFKPIKTDVDGNVDPDNPFGATIKVGGRRGALNIVYEEGDWSGWSRNISSQILSKQLPSLAKKQLKLARDLRKEEYEEIMSLTNPVVKRAMLEKFADGADSSAVHLKAAALPRQASHVILPVTKMKPNEVYAPMFENGENVALLRHPHGGIFEIAELTVNNRNPEARAVMGNARDALGIHPSVAAKLSGADFDGDTVIAIPNKKGHIKSSPSLTALKDFDPREAYAPFDGMKTVDGGIYKETTKKVDYRGKDPATRTMQIEMGNVSNLITDMTIKGASQAEIARAVKHSMVVIDAEKHHLNYKQSAIDNGISQLKEKYQGSPRAGASTLVSKASSEQRVPYRTEGARVGEVSKKTGQRRKLYVDPNTGEKLYTTASDEDRYYINKAGKRVEKTTRSTKMAEAKSAFQLSSGTKMETIYAEHADELKGLAKQARKEATKVPRLVYNREAAHTYAKEVQSLQAKVRIAERNRPVERKAQLVANKIYQEKLKANPSLDGSDKKRLRGQALTIARLRLGAKKPVFEISDREWNAIQLGALSHNAVTKIVRNTPLEVLKQKALPRTAYKMTSAKVARAKSMAASGYTPAEIASALGVSATTIVDTINN